MPYLWPIILVVASNVLYQICAKSVPESMAPFASMTITYVVAVTASVFMYYVLGEASSWTDLIKECAKTNWAPIAMGLVVAAMEVGLIHVYRVGWPVSTASLIQSLLSSVILVIVGAILYRETITADKMIGTILCLFGLYFINK